MHTQKNMQTYLTLRIDIFIFANKELCMPIKKIKIEW